VTGSWDIEGLAVELAAAAIEQERWTSVLECLSRSVGAVGAVLLPPISHRVDSISTSSVAEVSDRYIKEGWYTRDLRDRGLPWMQQRGVAVDLDFATEHDLKCSPYYNEFLGRHGLRWSAMLGVTCAFNDTWIISIQRSIGQGPFVAAEQERLSRLRGPFSTAARVARELSLARATGLAEAFDVMGSAAVILDRRGRVLRTNQAADVGLGGPELRIARGMLVAADHDTGKRIARLVDRTCSPDSSGIAPPIVVLRPGRAPLVVYSLPLAGNARDVFSLAQALVVVVDLAASSAPPTAHLRQAFGLTAAETRLAARLVTGDSLADAADALGIAKSTARVQLRAVFAKTGVSRQAELVGLLGRLARPAQRR
jgi:DNA-binding CsgD family transcriptional regulator